MRGDLSACNEPRESVCQEGLIANPEVTIATARVRFFPEPTRAQFGTHDRSVLVDFRPEALDWICALARHLSRPALAEDDCLRSEPKRQRNTTCVLGANGGSLAVPPKPPPNDRDVHTRLGGQPRLIPAPFGHCATQHLDSIDLCHMLDIGCCMHAPKARENVSACTT
jgi:hypothetical protein